jgi:AraC-like DNA-binding protein
MQEDPAAQWTVARLGTATGLSRAAFARRFADLVGEPPMTFLTGWRLSLAADLLEEPGATIASVARKVGYSTPFAFSTAFKRFHEVSPQQHRRLVDA